MNPPLLVLSDALRRRIESEGASAYPNECCGILIGREVAGAGGAKRRIVDRLEPGKNVFEADEQYRDPCRQRRLPRDRQPDSHREEDRPPHLAHNLTNRSGEGKPDSSRRAGAG